MLVDSHCHLDYLNKKQPDGAEIAIADAIAGGVTYMQTISTTMQSFPDVLQVAKNHKNVFCSVGVHPCHVDDEPLVSYDELLENTYNDNVIGLGETGMDLFHNVETVAKQEESFRIHIAVARDTGIPVIIHTRNADSETMEILQQEYEKGPYKALIHCFTCSETFAKQALDLGFYISFSGILTFPKSEELREIAKNIPLDRILVETDSPYLAPVPFRGKPCQPAYTRYTAECLAEVKEVDYKTIAQSTTDNFFTLFEKAVR